MSANDHDSIDSLLDRSRRFLERQRDLYGEEIPILRGESEAPKATPAAAAGSPRSGSSSPAGPAVGFPATDPPTIDPFPYPDEPWTAAADLPALESMICDCQKCALGATRTKFVFGTGDPRADVMFVGEGPGADEDAQGEPFVGRAGQLLNKIIAAVGMKREQVYICNIVKCRPPGNRAPQPEEEEQCTPYLMKQIELVKPKFIICLGRTAAQWLLRTGDGLGALRGRIHDFRGTKLIVTYHPAALLRNPEWKKPTWEDMKMFMDAYEASRGR